MSSGTFNKEAVEGKESDATATHSASVHGVKVSNASGPVNSSITEGTKSSGDKQGKTIDIANEVVEKGSSLPEWGENLSPGANRLSARMADSTGATNDPDRLHQVSRADSQALVILNRTETPTETGATSDQRDSEVMSSNLSTNESDSALQGRSASDDEDDEDDDSEQKETETGSTKKRLSKEDRAKLRKGKWTVEEEEYTTRIIHHFSTGLLTLPEGTTLRSYLAEKLNCDPMRITKKFAGASCLGKRVYHLCDRSQTTAADVEMAKAELARLDQRFRMRVEHGQSGFPRPPTDVLPTIPGQAPEMLSPYGAPAPAALAASWLQSIASSVTGQGAYVPGVLHVVPGSSASPHTWGSPLQELTAPSPSVSNPGLLRSSVPSNPAASAGAPVVHGASHDAISLAWAQAAVALTPALQQLAAANLQQHQQQLQKAFETQFQAFAQQQVPPLGVPKQQAQTGVAMTSTQPHQFSAPPAAQIHFALPVQNLPLPNWTMSAPQHRPQAPVTIPIAPHPPTGAAIAVASVPSLPPLASQVSGASNQSAASPNRSKEDEDAGSMLMGFLTTLRQGYIEAKNKKDREERDRTLKRSMSSSISTGIGYSNETSSGKTSDPADSSPDEELDPSGGSNKDASSSEESDPVEGASRVPPRKRHKTKIGEFTKKNVAAHNTRMNALHANSSYEPQARDVDDD